MNSFLRLDERLRRIFRWVILAFSVLSASSLLLVYFGVFSADSYHEWAFWVTFIGITTVGLVQFFWRPESRNKTLLYVVLYHVFALLSFMFVAGYATLLIFIWLMLILVSDINFGRRAGFISSAVFLISLLVWFPRSPATTWGTFILLIILAIFIISLAMVVSEIRAIAESRGGELEQSREKERLERARLLALVNSLGDAVIATNEKGEIRIYNAAASSLLDTNIDLVGKPITRVLHLRDAKGQRIQLMKLLASLKGNLVRTDVSHQFPDKEKINLYMNVALIHLGYQSEGERGYTFLLRDITKEKSLEQERDEFISVVSHELRTPIAIAEGSLSNALVLQSRGVGQDVINQSIEEAHKQVMFLSKMANDLATLSRAERGAETLEVEQLDIYALLDQIRGAYEQQAKEKGLTLVIRAKGKIEPLPTSKLYVQEILQNFMTNAIKYTKAGTVTLTAENDKQKNLVLAVKDSGIGISKSDQKRLFEKFFRSEDYRTRESSGTGLGLYLVKKLSEQLGAKILVESRLNHGSTFSLVVPPISQPAANEKVDEKKTTSS